MLFDRAMLSPDVFYVSFVCSVVRFSQQNFYASPALLFVGFFLLMLMARSCYLRILAFATNHLIFRVFLQHSEVLKHLVLFCRSVSPLCVKMEITFLLKMLALVFSSCSFLLISHCKTSFQTHKVFCMSQPWYVDYVPLPVAKQRVHYIFFHTVFCVM